VNVKIKRLNGYVSVSVKKIEYVRYVSSSLAFHSGDMFVRFWFHDGSCVMYCALDEVDSSVVSCSTHLLGVYDQKYLQVSEH